MKNILLIIFFLLMCSSVNIQAEDSHKKEDYKKGVRPLTNSVYEWF